MTSFLIGRWWGDEKSSRHILVSLIIMLKISEVSENKYLSNVQNCPIRHGLKKSSVIYFVTIFPPVAVQ